MQKARFGLAIVLLLLSSVGMLQAQGENDLPSFEGQIAYIGTDHNVYTLSLENDLRVQLTNDAGQNRQYQWPTWSTDGRLAYFSVSVEDGQFVTSAYISPDGSADGELVFSGPEVFNYAYWSPGNCSVSENCRDLSVLLSSPARGMFVELIRDGLPEASSLTAGLGGPPFYYSWSPDGERMLWQRNNQRFDIYDANMDRVTDTLAEMPGAILAPAWSPVDDRLLLGSVNDSNGTDLVIAGNEETQVLVSDIQGLVSFSWSPDGNLVAYRERTANGFNALVVVDAVTGESIARSPSTGVISFFWSPNSQQIAYLTLAAPPGSFEAVAPGGHLLAQSQQQPAGIAWSILSVETGDVKQYGSFFPTRETVYLLQYFDQFAQSHRVWSSDSRHLLYSEITSEGPAVNLLDTTQAGSVPFTIAEGTIGIWSFG